MMYSFVNIVVEIPPDQERQAIAFADSLGNPMRPELARIIDQINRIHFCSITVVPADANTAPYIIFELSVDGEADSLLTELAREADVYLRPIFELAADFDGAGTLADLWREKQVHTGFGYRDVPGLNHCGTPGMSLVRIKQEAELATALETLYQTTPRADSALGTLQKVRERLKEDPRFGWAQAAESTLLLEAQKPGTIQEAMLASWPELLKTLFWPPILLGFLVAAFVVFPFSFVSFSSFLFTLSKYAVVAACFAVVFSLMYAIYVYLELRKLESKDHADDLPYPHDLLEKIRAREDHLYQNHMMGISEMKPGWLRQVTLRLALRMIASLVQRFYRPGFVGDIGTIHFARWFMIPGTNKLIFFSNYGGSWESYLEDFITKADVGLTGVWSNTLGFPKTRNLIEGGARDGDRFKRWARRQQAPTWCWYSAYPKLTPARIRKNAALRQGFALAATEAEARDWITLFGSEPLPRTELQSDHIQSLVFGGFGPLAHSHCLHVQLSDDVVASKQWLADLLPRIRFGDRRPAANDCAIVIGISARGLRKFGLSENMLAGFPNAFVSGMAKRDRILGDLGSNAPDFWLWGGSDDKAVDVTLLIYSSSEGALNSMVSSESERTVAAGGRVVFDLPLTPLPPKGTPFREAFGFVDGVSQPIIRGIGRHKPGTNPLHLVEPGEFVLGYPDGLGTFPQTPLIPAAKDSHDDLYPEPNNWPEQRLNFSEPMKNLRRDLGRDGSFLVLRQLEQHVDKFKAYTEAAAQQLAEDESGSGIMHVSPEWVAAKMMGRWQDGSSLIRHPNGPASEHSSDFRPDNDFLLGKEDPQGIRCPFGSHIRRSNPRDSQARLSPHQIAISNRRRILRLGRRYRQGEQEGVLFGCLNGDIERQFEFIQQTWSSNRSFHGLNDEVDPLFYVDGEEHSGEGKFTIPMPDGPRCIKGVSQFVTTRGGEYFFLPGLATLRFLTR